MRCPVHSGNGQNGLACDDFIVGARRSGFDIDNNGVLGVDQVIEP